MSMMHRRRMVIERAKKMNQEREEQTDGNQGQNDKGSVQEGQQSGQDGGQEGRQESSPQA
jgi:hypothetical protein